MGGTSDAELAGEFGIERHTKLMEVMALDWYEGQYREKIWIVDVEEVKAGTIGLEEREIFSISMSAPCSCSERETSEVEKPRHRVILVAPRDRGL
jgi:trehalose utilization protein